MPICGWQRGTGAQSTGVLIGIGEIGKKATARYISLLQLSRRVLIIKRALQKRAREGLEIAEHFFF